MSDKNDRIALPPGRCPRCGTQPYYDGHLPWCAELSETEERFDAKIAELEERLMKRLNADMRLTGRRR